MRSPGFALIGSQKAALALLFSGILIFSAFLHKQLGMDSFWDTANYHIFLGWTLLLGKFAEFGAAAQYHAYLNPVIDGINHLLFNTHPYLGAAFHSLFYLIFAYVLYQIITEVTKDLKVPFFALIACLIAITGAMTISLFGSWTNENIVAVPVLMGVYALIKGVRHEKILFFVLAGLAFGMATGLKLTAAHYVVGAIAACVISCPRLKPILAFIGALGVGFLLVDGYFMWVRWSLTDNPVFPLANNFFSSPYYPAGWKSFSQFEPGKLFYYLSLPVIWLSSGDFSEASSVRDGRLLLGYLGIMIFAAYSLKNKAIDRQKLALVVFFIFSFLAWMLAFRIYRYLIVLEALSGALFALGLAYIYHQGSKKIAVTIAIVAIPFLWHVTYYPDWGRRAWSDNFAKSNLVDLISTDSQALVFFADQRVSYLAPELHAANIPFASLYSQQWWEGRRAMTMIDPDISIDPLVYDVGNYQDIYFLQFSRFDLRDQSLYLQRHFPTHYHECIEVHSNTLWNPYLCQFKDMANLPGIAAGAKYNHTSEEIIFQRGWSHLEPTHRWTEGHEAALLFRTSQDFTCPKVATINGTSHGRQTVEFLINGVPALKTELEGQFVSEIPFPDEADKQSNITLGLLLPTARMPGNGDPRILGLAFHTMEINCKHN